MFPEWVKKYKTAGTTIKRIGNNYYLYHATSKYVPDKPYPVSQQTYIGKITSDGIIKDHGRIEERTYRILADREDISKILYSKWEHVVCIGEARLKRIRNNEVSEEIHYHLMSCDKPAEKYGRLARGHWEIKNKLHCSGRLLLTLPGSMRE